MYILKIDTQQPQVIPGSHDSVLAEGIKIKLLKIFPLLINSFYWVYFVLWQNVPIA